MKNHLFFSNKFYCHFNCFRLFWPILIAFILVNITNCKPKTNETRDATQQPDIALFDTFARQIELSLNQGDPSFFNDHFLLDSLISPTISRFSAPHDFQAGFMAGMKEQIAVGEQIVSAMGMEGYYKLLWVNIDTAAPKNTTGAKALFRMVNAAGLDYHIFSLQKKQNKDSIIISDFTIVRGGVAFSDLILRLYLSGLTEHLDSTIENQMTDFEKQWLQYQPQIALIEKSLNENKYKPNKKKQQTIALKNLNDLPQPLRNDKLVLLMELSAAQYLGGKQLNETIVKFNQIFPDDPIVDLVVLDYYFETNKPSKTQLTAIDNIEAKIGNDPYLNILRATIYTKQNNYTIADSLLTKAIAQEPDNEEPWWDLIELRLRQKQFEQTVNLFAPMQTQFNINPAEFLLADGYDAFFTSTPYLNWEKEHPIPDSVRQVLQKPLFGR
ncbi:MAG TPA: hypothetical protein PKD56_01855 [Chitinophagales bacterium]|nr:hypothetical protein [Chitinophagales bacterium]